jgi:hypothetical protein
MYCVGLSHDLKQQLYQKLGWNFQLVVGEHGLVETEEGELVLLVELGYLFETGVNSVRKFEGQVRPGRTEK